MARNVQATIELPVTFQANKDHVVAVIELDYSTLGIRFNSPEQLLVFVTGLMEKAVTVWPDNEYIKEYLSD